MGIAKPLKIFLDSENGNRLFKEITGYKATYLRKEFKKYLDIDKDIVIDTANDFDIYNKLMAVLQNINA
jgi:hypothetical protein